MTRVPNANSPVEIRKAFQQVKKSAGILLEGTSGEILIGVGVNVNPAWGTELTALTLLTVDNISINGAVISSDTGAISFSNENLTTTGTVAGVNVTSGENPGHTHTGTSLSGIDISADTNLSVTSPITLTDDDVGLDQSAIDHGSIGGRDGDDHTIYSLADGTRAFTGTVSGIDPTSTAHLATKEYVDQSVQFQFRYYFNDTESDISGYYEANTEPTGEPSSEFTTAGLGEGAAQALDEWITESGEPGSTLLEHGIYSMHIHAAVTVGNKPTRIFFRLYKRISGGAETLLATSEYSDYITTGVSVDIHATLADDVAILSTDRLVWKLLANVGVSGQDVTVVLYAEGSSSTHVDLPTSTEVLSSIFLRQDGTKELTGNMSVANEITIDGRDISADGALLDAVAGGKVAVDTNATPDFLGNAFNDGALRTSTGISFANGGDFVTLTTNDGEIAHDSLSGYDANKHIDHTGVSISSGSGLTGGGAITITQTLALDINGLDTVAIAPGDFIPFWDITAIATNKKITFTNFEAALTHDNLIAGTIADHDTTATGANLTSLTDDSMVDALHRHSELSASDGNPNPSLQADALGRINIVIDLPTYNDFLLIEDPSDPGNGGTTLTIKNTISEVKLRAYGSSALGILAGAAGLFAKTGNFVIGCGASAKSYLYSNNNYLIVPEITLDNNVTIAVVSDVGKAALVIDQNDADQVFINYQGTSAANAANSITTWTAGNSIQGFFWIEINGVKKRVAFYDEPTS